MPHEKSLKYGWEPRNDDWFCPPPSIVLTIFDHWGDVLICSLINTSAPSHWLKSVAWPVAAVLKLVSLRNRTAGRRGRQNRTMPQDLIGCRKRRKLVALIPHVVVFVNDPSSVEKRIDFAVFFIGLWSYGRKISLNMCHGNSENSCGCSYLLRICFIYGKWVYRGVESLCKLLTANKVHFDLPTSGCKSKYCPS